MTKVEDLVTRNATFAIEQFSEELTINPWGRMTVIACVDSRVDPAVVLGLASGEASVIRVMGGRVTASTLRTLVMLATVRQANIDTVVPGTGSVIVLHHTDCGMIDLAAAPDLLAEFFAIPVGQLDTKSVRDPYGSVRVDVEVLRAHEHAADTLVSGLVYDVDTGQIEVVIPPTPLDPE